jgi:phenylalanyl-tRNA synthetase beta chain
MLELPAMLPSARTSRTLLDLDERILSIKLTPNRGDCLSVLGVAREARRVHPGAAETTGLSANCRNFVTCFRCGSRRPIFAAGFSGRVVRGVQRARRDAGLDARGSSAGPASDLGAGRYLELRDARARAPVAYLRSRQGAGGLVVRWGRAGESVELLNGQTVEVDAGVGVIARRPRCRSRSPESWEASTPR